MIQLAHILQFEEGQGVVDEDGWPDEGFQKTVNAIAESRRELDVVHQRADKGQTIDSAAEPRIVYISAHFLPT